MRLTSGRSRANIAVDPQRPERPWHALDLQTVMSRLLTQPGGLSETEAARRLEVHGPNELPTRPPPKWWLILLRQFRSPIIYILVIAAAISVGTGHISDAGFIATVVGLNALIGGFQEFRADRSARSLQQLLQVRALSLREGEPTEIEARRVVPGDVVLLEPGNRVPADLRLISSRGLGVDESLLTGESTAVEKDAAWTASGEMPTDSVLAGPGFQHAEAGGKAAIPKWSAGPGREVALAEQRNMAFAGSIVVRGRGRGVVVATGAATQVGRLALDVLTTVVGKPPLMIRLERFTRVVGAAAVASAAALAAIGVSFHGAAVTEMLVFGIALAVAAIPEGLPVAITIALAVGARRMAKRRVIVRRLHAVEGLGSCTLIASDKTGTLTCNELTVRRIRPADGRLFEASGEGFSPDSGTIAAGGASGGADGRDGGLQRLLCIGVLCNEATLHRAEDRWVWHGDPTDVALLTAARKAGIEQEATLEALPLVESIAFEPERRYAASFHAEPDGILLAVKGAPECVLPMCDLDAPTRQRHLRAAEEMARDGFRVLALAEGRAATADASGAPHEPRHLRFAGFVGMIDPLRAGVREAVAECKRAGVTVSMVTGDHPVTALAIARELGMADSPEQVVTGEQLERCPPEELAGLVARTRVFARVAPHQKLQIVEAAKRAGHFVAVTGDGVNDAPALRSANVGVAMGRSGTDLARESSDLVITDDNFATIVAGVEEGRVAYDNIRKVVLLLLSTGAAEVVVVALGVIAGTPLPLLPVQLLWLNLVTNGIQDVALALEPNEGDVMRRRPRKSGEPIINRLMVRNTLSSAVLMGVIGFGVFLWMLRAGWSESGARNGLLLLMVLFENGPHRQLPLRNEIRLPPLPAAQPAAAGGRGGGAGTARADDAPAAWAEPPADLARKPASLDRAGSPGHDSADGAGAAEMALAQPLTWIAGGHARAGAGVTALPLSTRRQNHSRARSGSGKSR